MIAFELLLGRPPFVADDVAETIALRLHQPPPDPRELRPDLPAMLGALLQSLLEREPARRPPLSQVRQALAAGSMEIAK